MVWIINIILISVVALITHVIFYKYKNILYRKKYITFIMSTILFIIIELIFIAISIYANLDIFNVIIYFMIFIFSVYVGISTVSGRIRAKLIDDKFKKQNDFFEK